MFKPLKSFLGNAIHRKDIREGVRGAVVLDRAREAVEIVFPARVAPMIQPSAFNSGIITLTVPSPAISQEIRMRGAKFLEVLNEQLGKKVVIQIRIRLVPPEARQENADMLR